MKTNKHFAPVATMTAILFVLAILFSACSAIPEYGTLITQTPAPSPTSTALPSARQAVSNYQTAMMGRDSTEPLEQYKTRLCALATISGCAYLNSELFKTVKYGNEHYAIKAKAIIKELTMVAEGTYPSGTAWQVWEVKASYDKPWAGLRTNDLDLKHTFVFVNGEWKYDGLSVMVKVEPTLKP